MGVGAAGGGGLGAILLKVSTQPVHLAGVFRGVSPRVAADGLDAELLAGLSKS